MMQRQGNDNDRLGFWQIVCHADCTLLLVAPRELVRQAIVLGVERMQPPVQVTFTLDRHRLHSGRLIQLLTRNKGMLEHAYVLPRHRCHVCSAVRG
jgi:hypothetical protein